jgi:oligopeptidase B
MINRFLIHFITLILIFFSLNISNAQSNDNCLLIDKDSNIDVAMSDFILKENFKFDSIIINNDSLINELENKYYSNYYVPPKTKLEYTVKKKNVISEERIQGYRYPILKIRKGDSLFQVLNLNKLSNNSKYFNYVYKYSPDFSFLAFLYDTTGNENYKLIVVDTKKGVIISENIKNLSKAFEFHHNNLILTEIDSVTLRWSKIIYFDSSNLTKKIIYEELNQNLNTYIELVNKHYLIQSEGTNSNSQQLILFGKHKKFKLLSLSESVEWSQNKIQIFNNNIYKLTYNINGKSIIYSAKDYDTKNSIKWEEIYTQCNDTIVENFLIYKDYLIIKERKELARKVVFYNHKIKSKIKILIPYVYFDINMDEVKEYYDSLEFKLYTPLVPKQIIRINVKDQVISIIPPTIDSAVFKPQNYEFHVIYVNGEDSAQIPLTLYYNKQMLKKQSPIIIDAYGAYGHFDDYNFNKYNMIMANKGFIMATAHVRGSGAKGLKWHKFGSGLYKKNSIYDFISCCEYLINNRYTSKKKLYATGGSAGGIVVGGALVSRPDLFGFVYLRSPFVDIQNGLSNSSENGASTSYLEFGNPNKLIELDTIISYSPLQNITSKNYPTTYIRCNKYDSRVQYWQAINFACKLKKHQNSQNQIHLKTNLSGGHIKSNPIKELTEIYAIIIKSYLILDE